MLLQMSKQHATEQDRLLSILPWLTATHHQLFLSEQQSLVLLKRLTILLRAVKLLGIVPARWGRADLSWLAECNQLMQ